MAKRTNVYERCMEIYLGIERRYGRALDRLAKGPAPKKGDTKETPHKPRKV